MLSTALQPLLDYKQFILYKLVWNEAKQKNEKVPVNSSGYDAKLTDPNEWLTYQEAADVAPVLGFHVGFVFTPHDPFFFIDIDDCLTPDQQWTPQAQELMNMFNGAAIEVSQSGKGLHIIGTGTVTDDRRCKSKDNVFDLYTKYRFVALTDTNTIGHAGYDFSAQLRHLVEHRLQLDDKTLNADWTDQPVEEYSVIESDDELITKALNAKDANMVFNGKSKFQCLWEADNDALATWYPHDTTPGLFDHSRADAALCSALAFWTGKDCARVDRLFRASGLYRVEKWDKRPKYAQETILKSVGKCEKVYTAGKNREIIVPTGSRFKLKDPDSNFMYPDEQITYFEGCTWIKKLDAIYTPSGDIFGKSQFNTAYGGYWFILDHGNEGKTRSAWEAFTLNQAYEKPVADLLCFRPEYDHNCEIVEAGRTLINSYRPVETAMMPGEYWPLLDLIARMLPDIRDQEIFICYLAALVQYPGVKFRWTPVLQGTEGNGKTTFLKILKYCVSELYTFIPNSKHLDNPFNAWLDRKLFIGVDEIKVNHRIDVLETLKPMIANDSIEIQYKGKDQGMADNRANFLMCTNHKDAIPVSVDTRRYSIFYTKQQCKADNYSDGLTPQYFVWFYDWLENYCGYEVCNWFLRNYRINPEYNPAGMCVTAPKTSTSDEAIAATMGAIEQEIMECVTQNEPGFRGGWISSIALTNLLYRLGKRVTPNKRNEILMKLGYVKHPKIKRGVANRNIVCLPDMGKRPVLYIRSDMIDPNAPDYDVAALYEAAQVDNG